MKIRMANWKITAALLAALLSACGGRGEAAIKAYPQTITFAAAPGLTLNGSATVSASASSGLAVSYSSATPAICTVDAASGLVTNLAAGKCTIAADQNGDTTYSPAAQVTLDIIVSGATQTISFGAAPVLEQDGYAIISALASSGLAVSYSSLTPTVCSVDSSSGILFASTSGNCTIAADQAGDSYTLPASQASQTFSITTHVGPATAPGQPQAVSASLNNDSTAILVNFIGPATLGGSPLTGYNVTSNPAGLFATASTSPISVSCPSACAGYAISVSASNSAGTSVSTTPVDVVTNYDVTTRFYEPDTQPNDTIFTGSFTLNSTTGAVSGLSGTLTESMLTPMPLVPLVYQLSSVNIGNGGLLVSSFALNTTDTYAEGGFSANSDGLYFGFFDNPRKLNPASGGVGNSFVTIYVNTNHPTATPTATEINSLAYGDCAAGGMMGDVCMTGYSGAGTMGGYPVAQTISRK